MENGFESSRSLILTTYSSVHSFPSFQQWNRAWDDWHKKNVEYVFQQDVNGKLDCIRSAVMKSVQQVCEEKFPSGPFLEDNSEVSQKDLEEAILRRRQSVL